MIVKAGYRVDMVVEELILIENKSVKGIERIHEAQLLTYLKLSGFKVGFLINWNVLRMKDGIRRKIVRGGHTGGEAPFAWRSSRLRGETAVPVSNRP